jgi:hypothetical protein
MNQTIKETWQKSFNDVKTFIQTQTSEKKESLAIWLNKQKLQLQKNKSDMLETVNGWKGN